MFQNDSRKLVFTCCPHHVPNSFSGSFAYCERMYLFFINNCNCTALGGSPHTHSFVLYAFPQVMNGLHKYNF